MAVNLLPTDVRDAAKRAALRRTVNSATTLVLVIYLVIVAGVGGWWLYLSTRESQLTSQIQALTTSIAQKAQAEVLLRQEADRITQIDAKYKGRMDLPTLAQKIFTKSSDLNISTWTMAAGDANSQVSVSSNNVSSIEDYGYSLLTNFSQVTFNNLSHDLGAAWSGILNLPVFSK